MIYFIQAGTDGPIKIGQTENDVYSRMKQLQTGCPEELHLLWTYHGSGFTEQELHTGFCEYNIRGEWFRPDEYIFNFIRENLYHRHQYDSQQFGDIEILEAYKNDIQIKSDFFKICLIKNKNKRWIFYFKCNDDINIITPDSYRVKAPFGYTVKKSDSNTIGE